MDEIEETEEPNNTILLDIFIILVMIVIVFFVIGVGIYEVIVQ